MLVVKLLDMGNIVAYADDIVLLAPSWRALQLLLTTLVAQAHAIDLYCNTDKTVAMVFRLFPPKNRRLVIGNDFPLFRLGYEVIKYVSSFKYLGHVITQNCSDEREIRNLFIRTTC